MTLMAGGPTAETIGDLSVSVPDGFPEDIESST